MQSFLRKAWGVVTDKLGAISAFLIPIAEKLEIAIRGGDVDKIKAIVEDMRVRAHETRELCDAMDEFCDHADAAVADGRLDAIEAGEGALLLERMIDEAEDIVTGVDEDDAPEGGGHDGGEVANP